MTTTISSSTETLTPLLLNGYQSARTSGNIVHDIIGSSVPAVTLRPAGLRAGELTVVVGSRALALQFEELLSAGEVLTLDDTTTDVAMTFVVTEEISIEQDDVRALWLVTFSYQEVAE